MNMAKILIRFCDEFDPGTCIKRGKGEKRVLVSTNI